MFITDKVNVVEESNVVSDAAAIPLDHIVSLIAQSSFTLDEVERGRFRRPLPQCWNELLKSMSRVALRNLKHLQLDLGVFGFEHGYDEQDLPQLFDKLVQRFVNDGVQLESLDLKSVGFPQTCFDAVTIYLSLPVGRKLESLRLESGSAYEEIDVKSFARAVAAHTTLTRLALLDVLCADTDKGVALLRDAALQNTSLRCLDFSSTGLFAWEDDEGVPFVETTENPYCDIVLANKPALHSLVLNDIFDVPHCRLFAEALRVNYWLTRLDLQLRSRASHKDVEAQLLATTIDRLLQRNRSLQWRTVHAYLLDICLAFAPLQLPTYVLLEIFDWLPTHAQIAGIDYNESSMYRVSHIKKIRLIERVLVQSRRAVLAAREKRVTLKKN